MFKKRSRLIIRNWRSRVLIYILFICCATALVFDALGLIRHVGRYTGGPSLLGKYDRLVTIPLLLCLIITMGRAIYLDILRSRPR